MQERVAGTGLPLPVGTVGLYRGRASAILYAAAARAAAPSAIGRQWGGGLGLDRDSYRLSTSGTGARAAPFEDLIRGAAQREGIDEQLVKAVVEAESGFNPRAVSSAGAKGLMQLMDGTARSLGVKDPFDPASNLEGGVKFLRGLLDRFGSLPMALAAYNAGPGAVERFGGIPPYQETRAYVDRVMQLHRRNQLGSVGAAGKGDRGK